MLRLLWLATVGQSKKKNLSTNMLDIHWTGRLHVWWTSLAWVLDTQCFASVVPFPSSSPVNDWYFYCPTSYQLSSRPLDYVHSRSLFLVPLQSSSETDADVSIDPRLPSASSQYGFQQPGHPYCFFIFYSSQKFTSFSEHNTFCETITILNRSANQQVWDFFSDNNDTI